MSDNPFAEPEDDNRTVIRPTPGRRRTPAAEQPTTARSEQPPSDTQMPAQRPAVAAEGTEDMAVGGDVLTVAAAPLLQLMARLRNTASPPDSGDLYQRTVRQIRVFEQEARDKGVPLEQLRPAHYALCASLDDIVLNTPWGSSGTWSQRSLVSTFHQEVRSGERFFDVLKQMSANPGRFLPVIELMYICMSLGFIGQYRLSRRGVGEHQPDPRRNLCRHRPPEEAGGTRARPAYEGRKRALPAGALHRAALGRRRGRAGRHRRALPLVLDQPQRGIRHRLRPPAGRAAGSHADDHPHAGRRARARDRRSTAAARAVGARQAAPVPEAGDRSEARRGARHAGAAAGAHHRPRHVRVGQRHADGRASSRCSNASGSP